MADHKEQRSPQHKSSVKAADKVKAGKQNPPTAGKPMQWIDRGLKNGKRIGA